jgi:hypothetical protein
MMNSIIPRLGESFNGSQATTEGAFFVFHLRTCFNIIKIWHKFGFYSRVRTSNGLNV